MGSLSAYLSLALVGVTASLAPAQSPGPKAWRTFGDVVHDGRTMNPSLAEGPRGILMCTYQDVELSGRGSTSVFNVLQRVWYPAGEEGRASAGRDWWPTIRFGLNGEVYRFNYDYGLGGRLGLRKLDFGPQSQLAWTLPLGTHLSTGQAHTPDAIIDAQNRPIVCFQDGPGGNTPSQSQGGITVLRVNMETGQTQALGGAGFSDQFIPAGQRSIVWHTKIDQTVNGTIYAAWTEMSSGGTGNRLHVARYSESTDQWALLGTPGLGVQAQGAHLNMQLNQHGVPVVAYRGQNPRSLRVRRWHPWTNSWIQVGDDIAVAELGQQIGAVGFSDNSGYRESVPFVIDDIGRMYIACRAHDSQGDRRMKTWTFAGGSWQTMGVNDGFLPGSGDEDYASFIAVGGRIPVLSCRRRPDQAGERLVVHGFY